MTVGGWARLAGAVQAAMLLPLVPTLPSAAQPALRSVAEPALALDRLAAPVGDAVLVRLAGWPAGVVMIELCGGAALGGSADCLVAASAITAIGTDGTGMALLRVRVPPTPCPCVVRARSVIGGTTRAVPLIVRGAAVRPVVAAARKAGVIARLRWDLRTRAYIDRRVSEGKTRREAIRCLKRYIARELYELIAQTALHTSPPIGWVCCLTSIGASNSNSVTRQR